MIHVNYITPKVREVFDDMNPRIYTRQYMCHDCGKWIEEDDIVWIKDNPYHVECAPEQEDYT